MSEGKLLQTITPGNLLKRHGAQIGLGVIQCEACDTEKKADDISWRACPAFDQAKCCNTESIRSARDQHAAGEHASVHHLQTQLCCQSRTQAAVLQFVLNMKIICSIGCAEKLPGGAEKAGAITVLTSAISMHRLTSQLTQIEVCQMYLFTNLGGVM